MSATAKNRRLPPHLLARLGLFTVLIVVSFFLSGCITLTDHEASQDQRQEVVGYASAEETFTQAIQVQRDGLNGIQLWLQVPGEVPPEDARLTVQVKTAPQNGSTLSSTLFKLADIQSNGAIHIPLPLQKDSAGQSLYLLLSANQGRAEVLGRNGGIYPQGGAYNNDQPLEGDAAFSLSYDYGPNSIFEDLLSLLRYAWLVIPIGVLIILPGWLLLVISGLAARFDPGQRLGLSIGLSLALIPVVLTWTTAIGWHWNQNSAILTAILLVFAWATYRWWVMRGRRYLEDNETLTTNSQVDEIAIPAGEELDASDPSSGSGSGEHLATSLALGAILLFSLFVRVAMVRDLSAPPWVDSVHHGLFTRLIQQVGAFPDNYAPFLDIPSGSYHLGFHSVLSFFLWLSGLDLPEGMLIFGQALNALAVIGVYLFTRTLTGNRVAGLFAALIAGVLTPMPAYYTSWGRYTHLTGLLILPAAIALFKAWFDIHDENDQNVADEPPFKRQRWVLILTLALACAGAFITHLRVTAFLGLLIFLILVFQEIRYARQGILRKRLPQDLGFLALAMGVCLLLVSPWLSPLLSNLILPKINAWRGAPAEAFVDFAWNYLTSAQGKLTLVLAGLGFVWGLLRKRLFPLLLVCWVALAFFLANLHVFNLPGAGFVNSTAVAISLFLPISALGGYFIADVIGLARKYLPGRWRVVPLSVGVLLALLAAVLGFREMLPLLNPVTFLFRAVDRPALTWIENQLPAGEPVLVNPFAWGYSLYGGTDGGYWMSALTDNPSMPPPVLYGLDNDPGQMDTINQLSQEVINLGSDPQAIYDLMVEHSIRYIYIGGRGGPLAPGALRASDLFTELYAEGGTFVLERK